MPTLVWAWLIWRIGQFLGPKDVDNVKSTFFIPQELSVFDDIGIRRKRPNNDKKGQSYLPGESPVYRL